ncbi:MAG: GGDEF domain-containing protein [Chromatiales bacterium]|jgi:diguanylate cyclase (GGDEF)-like protein
MEQQSEAADFKQKTRADKLHLLFELSFPAVFISLVNASLFLAALWPDISHSKLKVWYAALVITSLIRIFLFHRYRFRCPVGEAVLTWELPYFITLILSASVWGLGGLWLIVPASGVDQIIIFFFLIGMAGGAMSVYSALRPMVLATVASVLLPVTLWLLIAGEGAPRVAALASLLFLFSSVRSTRVLSTALHQNFLLRHQLTHAKEQAEKAARTDYLTRLNNRGAFYELADKQIAYCKRHEYPLSLIALDLDDFKCINDTYGHAAGDDALRQMAGLIRNNTRTYDVSGRMGGEEFVILLPDAGIEQAGVVAEKIRAAMEEHKIAVDGQLLKVTASFGAATSCADCYDLDKLLALADKALYEAKAAGKNQVQCSDVELPKVQLA